MGLDYPKKLLFFAFKKKLHLARGVYSINGLKSSKR